MMRRPINRRLATRTQETASEDTLFSRAPLSLASPALQPSVAFVIPCFNEEATVAQVVRDCRAAWPQAEIYVFDNNSTDRTVSEALQAGAQVVHSPRQGKGHVIRHAFAVLDADVVVMLDGDGTYRASLAKEMIEVVLNEGVHMVVCNRISETSEVLVAPATVAKAGSSTASKPYPRFHRFGNRLFSRFVSALLGHHVTDVFSGYRAVSREFYDSLVLDSEGFEIESELTLKATSQGFEVKEIFGPYKGRPAGSHSKLKTFKDGFKILKYMFWVMRDCRPLLFFGSAAFLCVIFSLWSGSAPILDYLRFQYVFTVPRAVLAASLMVMAFMLFGIGVVLDSQVRHLRQQTQLLRRWLVRTQETRANPVNDNRQR
jgi:glycosyltransferase involved in cell wall biosynthesis